MIAMNGSCSFGRKGHFLIGLLSVTILFAICWLMHMNQIEECVSVSEHPCMNVTGSVLGKINDNTTVALYKAEGLDYTSIIEEITEGHPERVSKISANQSFAFFCLPEGHYLLSIPASSYNFSFGSPIPVESDQGDLKVKAILQGGNSQNMFSAFSIERTS
ncbi:MAG: hypothetical protein ACOYOS_17895 [Syntrophales bacterium]